MTTRTLYYASGACSLAAHIILEESGLPYEGLKLDLAAGDQRRPEYLAINDRAVSYTHLTLPTILLV